MSLSGLSSGTKWAIYADFGAGDVFLGLQTTHSVNIARELVDVSNKMAANVRTIIPNEGRVTADVTSDLYFDDNAAVQSAMTAFENGDKFKLTAKNTDTGDVSYASDVFISAVNDTGADNTGYVRSVTFSSDGTVSGFSVVVKGLLSHSLNTIRVHDGFTNTIANSWTKQNTLEPIANVITNPIQSDTNIYVIEQNSGDVEVYDKDGNYLSTSSFTVPTPIRGGCFDLDGNLILASRSVGWYRFTGFTDVANGNLAKDYPGADDILGCTVDKDNNLITSGENRIEVRDGFSLTVTKNLSSVPTTGSDNGDVCFDNSFNLLINLDDDTVSAYDGTDTPVTATGITGCSSIGPNYNA